MSSWSRRGARNRVYSMVALGMICVVAIVVMGSLLARGHQAIGAKVYPFPHKTLYALAKTERRFLRKDPDEDGRFAYASSLAELEAVGYITNRLAKGEVGGYRYRILQADARTFAITATPAAISSQSLFYFVDHTFRVRSQTGRAADATSPLFWEPGNRMR